jgi:NADH-quinone oxidoreductase subunit K
MIFTLPNIAIVVVIGLIGLQVAVKGAMVALVLAGRLSSQVDVGQSLALTVIVADTVVAVVALALAVQVRQKFGTLDIQALTTLRR